MVELTDSQKILLQPIAAALGCAADPEAIVSAAKGMRAWKDNLMRSRFGLLALLFVDADDIDAGIDWLIKKGQKKKK